MSLIPEWLRKTTRRDRRIQAAADYWSAASGGLADDVEYWMNVPAVRATANQRVSGEAGIDYLDYFLLLLGGLTTLPLGRVVSVGSGTGVLECKLVDKGIAQKVIGLDVGAACVSTARQLARTGGLEPAVEFHVVEAARWLESQDEPCDLIVFHGVLHHIEALEELLDLSAVRLGRGGRSRARVRVRIRGTLPQ